MALRVHSSKVEGVYKDNLPWVAGVEVEVKKTKRGYLKKGNGGEGRRKRKKINTRIDGLEG